MKIIVRCVGKERDKGTLEACAEYLKRLPWNIKFEELPQSNREEEGTKLLAKDFSNSYKIVLDEKGQEFTSTEFAEFLEKKSQHKEIVFFIGGAYGLSDSVRKSADSIVSLSKMTLPHKMVRLFLCEQLYRAYTINTNHPYHK